MWMAILKSQVNKKYSKNTKKAQPTENQKNTKTEIWAKWKPGFYIWLTKGKIAHAPCQLHHCNKHLKYWLTLWRPG